MNLRIDVLQVSLNGAVDDLEVTKVNNSRLEVLVKPTMLIHWRRAPHRLDVVL